MLLTKESKPPFRHHSGRDSRCRAGASPHCVFHSGRDYKRRLRLRRGDARGEAPCIRKLKNLPLPRRGRGAGGWGHKRKLKAGQAGGKESTPPPQGTTAAKQADTANKPQKNKKRRSRAFNQNFQPSNLSSHYHKIHLQPKRRKRRGEKETQTNEEPLHRRGERGSSPRSISIG